MRRYLALHIMSWGVGLGSPQEKGFVVHGYTTWIWLIQHMFYSFMCLVIYCFFTLNIRFRVYTYSFTTRVSVHLTRFVLQLSIWSGVWVDIGWHGYSPLWSWHWSWNFQSCSSVKLQICISQCLANLQMDQSKEIIYVLVIDKQINPRICSLFKYCCICI